MNIAFVHLGNKIPKYLKYNLDAIVKSRFDAKVWLISECNSDLSKVSSEVEVFRYQRTNETDHLAKKLKHSKEFRNDFWFLSIERFFALEQFLTKYNEPTIHVESDVILSDDFPVKHIEKHFKYMCFPIVSGKRGIASCVYMENVHPIRKLSKFVKDEISQNPLTTDMLIIDRFYKLNQDSLMLFPTANPSIGHYNNLADENFIRKVNSSFSQLQGVIDGHDLGVNYLGTDPRNARGIKYFFRPIEGTFIDINKVKLRYNKNRKFVDISSPNSIEYFPVYALHATSKALLLFNRHSRSIYLRSIFLKDKKRQKKSISFLVVISGILKKLKFTLKSI